MTLITNPHFLHFSFVLTKKREVSTSKTLVSRTHYTGVGISTTVYGGMTIPTTPLARGHKKRIMNETQRQLFLVKLQRFLINYWDY